MSLPSVARGLGLVHKDPPQPTFVTPNTRKVIDRSALKFPTPSGPLLTMRVLDAENVSHGVWHGVSSFVRWDVESGLLWLYTERFTQRGGNEYEVVGQWGLRSTTFPALVDDPDLEFEDTVVWDPELIMPGTDTPMFAHSEGLVHIIEWWTDKIAMLPQDHPASGIIMRAQHRDLRQQYVDGPYVYHAFPGIVLPEAENYRRFVTLGFVPAGASVLDLACGVGTVGSLVMERAKPADRWNVHFVDASAKMMECTRDTIISRFGQPPANQSRFQVFNVCDPQHRVEIKKAFRQPSGFGVVFGSKFTSSFKNASLRQVLIALLDLCAVGGAVVVDLAISCKYHESVLGDEGTERVGGILEIDSGPLREELQSKDWRVSNATPVIRGKDPSAPKILGSHYIRNEDLNETRAMVQKVVDEIPGAVLETVQAECDRSRYRDETAAIETAAGQVTNVRVKNRSRDIKRDFVRWERGSAVSKSTTGPVIRRRFGVVVICRVKKTA